MLLAEADKLVVSDVDADALFVMLFPMTVTPDHEAEVSSMTWLLEKVQVTEFDPEAGPSKRKAYSHRPPVDSTLLTSVIATLLYVQPVESSVAVSPITIDTRT